MIWVILSGVSLDGTFVWLDICTQHRIFQANILHVILSNVLIGEAKYFTFSYGDWARYLYKKISKTDNALLIGHFLLHSNQISISDMIFF